jgi:hypothetical protein
MSLGADFTDGKKRPTKRQKKPVSRVELNMPAYLIVEHTIAGKGADASVFHRGRRLMQA